MDVRTFEAFSMKDAVKSVKKTLGADAVILSTKEKPAPGGKGTLYEVTAASAQNDRRSGMNGARAQSEQAQAPSINTELDHLSGQLATLAASLPTRGQVQALEAGMQELKLLMIETLRSKDGSMLKDLPADIVPLERQLSVMGISEPAIVDLTRHLRSLPPPEKDGEAYYRDQAIRWMMKRIKIAPRWNIMPGTVSYQGLVGPTGVGKSALVAKLAAHYAMREKNKVAVVSLDNHRLAASDQMRIFCKIINVPFLAANAPEDLLSVHETFRGTELVLIDTAGVSPKNKAGLDALAAVKELSLPIDFHLCLSSTESPSQLDHEVRSFLSTGLSTLIFSKLDESWAYGEIFNLSKTWSLPLSFFSIGQQIPDDIERASRERVIERIFGL